MFSPRSQATLSSRKLDLTTASERYHVAAFIFARDIVFFQDNHTRLLHKQLDILLRLTIPVIGQPNGPSMDLGAGLGAGLGMNLGLGLGLELGEALGVDLSKEPSADEQYGRALSPSKT